MDLLGDAVSVDAEIFSLLLHAFRSTNGPERNHVIASAAHSLPLPQAREYYLETQKPFEKLLRATSIIRLGPDPRELQGALARLVATITI